MMFLIVNAKGVGALCAPIAFPVTNMTPTRAACTLIATPSLLVLATRHSPLATIQSPANTTRASKCASVDIAGLRPRSTALHSRILSTRITTTEIMKNAATAASR